MVSIEGIKGDKFFVGVGDPDIPKDHGIEALFDVGNEGAKDLPKMEEALAKIASGEISLEGSEGDYSTLESTTHENKKFDRLENARNKAHKIVYGGFINRLADIANARSPKPMKAYIFVNQSSGDVLYFQIGYRYRQAPEKIGSGDLRHTVAFTGIQQFSDYLEKHMLGKPFNTLADYRTFVSGIVRNIGNGLQSDDFQYNSVFESTRPLNMTEIQGLSKKVRRVLMY